MFSLMLGHLLGFLLAGIIGLLWLGLGEEMLWSHKNIKKLRAVVVAILLLVIIGGGWIGVYIGRCSSAAYCRQFEAQKLTIESSIRSEYLTGLERAALVSEAARYNGELGQKQYAASQWYGMDISKEIFNLEPIQFE